MRFIGMCELFNRVNTRPTFNYIPIIICLFVTELCSGESLPEVEIISLLEEQIPQYKLRADTLTKFGGELLLLLFDLFVFIIGAKRYKIIPGHWRISYQI